MKGAGGGGKLAASLCISVIAGVDRVSSGGPFFLSSFLNMSFTPLSSCFRSCGDIASWDKLGVFLWLGSGVRYGRNFNCFS